MAEGGDDDYIDDDDDHSPSARSAASLELYQSVRATIIPDGLVRDKDQLSMKSDCAAGMRRRLSILDSHQHKVRGLRSVRLSDVSASRQLSAFITYDVRRLLYIKE